MSYFNWNPIVIGALVGLLGVVIGLIARDVFMALVLANRKRQQELSDRRESEAHFRIDLLRRYVDPLTQASRSLGFRLTEILETGDAARYLLQSTPASTFVVYKRLSTLYRLAALLGWIQAFRRERGLLDPDDPSDVVPLQQIESALADGHHVETQRLDELSALWKISPISDEKNKRQAAVELDSVRHAFLTEAQVLTAASLTPEQRRDLAIRCAEVLSRHTGVAIPYIFVHAKADETCVSLGIKEAYIYRDWQAAIGDLMIRELTGAPARRFDVMGFGEFEGRYRSSRDVDTMDRRWFDRLEALFLDLDVSKTGIFDARSDQLKRLRMACESFVSHLADKRASPPFRT